MIKKDRDNEKVPFVRSFGRVKSRKLGVRQNDLLQNLLPSYEFLNSHLDQKFLQNQNLTLEVGFGFGDFTFELARNNPNANILAGETHLNGIINLLGKLEQNPLSNIKIFKSDIRLLLSELPDKIFSQIYILFPDPWPKAKHYKRRLINTQFLNLLSKKIKNSGKLIIATDHDSYKVWIMNAMVLQSDFIWTAKEPSDWQNFPNDWVVTKYQKKAAIEGRKSVYLEFEAKNLS